MKRTITAQVLDKPGTLNRLTSTFTRRQYNIISLCVSPTEITGVSNITFIVEVEHIKAAEQMIKVLNKQINIIHVEDITESNTLNRELVLIHLNEPKYLKEVQRTIEQYKEHASMLKNENGQIYLQAFGPHELMNEFINQLKNYSITNISRSGLAFLL